MKNTFYKIELNPELPGNGVWGCPIFYFPSDQGPMTSYAIAKIITPQRQWVGYFAPGFLHFTGVWQVPESSFAIIVSAGCAYLVDLDAPDNSKELPSDTVENLVKVEDRGMLLLNDEQQIMAVDKSGVKWISDRLVRDDLQIITVQSGMVICRGTELPSTELQISVSLNDGKLINTNVRPPKDDELPGK